MRLHKISVTQTLHSPENVCVRALMIVLMKSTSTMSTCERVLVDHIAEIYAHTLSPDGNNPEQPMSIKEICENCIESLKGVDQ